MEKIKVGRVVLSGLVMGITFLFVEIVIEGLTHLLFGISEAKAMEKVIKTCPYGFKYYILVFIYLFLICFLIMGVYAAIRPRFKSFLTAAFVTSMIFWIFLALVSANLAMAGLFPAKVALMSLIFNLIELPSAVIVGSLVYRNP